MTRINLFFDAIPQLYFSVAGRPIPAYRTCGVAGFYVALLVSGSLALFQGLSLSVFLAATSAAVASFFALAMGRKAITGRETLVLLDHVWLAIAAVAALLHTLHIPVLPYLDVMAPGLGLFLAGGRAGCLLVGCCHGNPSQIGVRYGDAHAAGGFPARFVNVRLFPVQAIELAGLLAIASVSVLMLGRGRPGASFVWFLFGYAVLRFGMEGLRGDERPMILGMSIPRAMCLVQLGAAAWIADRGAGPTVYVFLLSAAILALAAQQVYDRRRTLLRARHIDEIRAAVRQLGVSAEPRAISTSRGVSVVASNAPGPQGRVHISLRMPGREDLWLACHLAGAAFPRLDSTTARYSDQHTIHLVLSAAEMSPKPADRQHAASAARRLFASVTGIKTPVIRPAAAPPATPRKPWFFRQAS